MKVAVLLSTYNGEKYLNEQLESLSNQTIAESMTIYIRDDGSTDRTFEIVERWQEKVSIVLEKAENVGPARSFWAMLLDNRIKADYYAFCDQDDIWDSDKIEMGIQQLQKGYQLTCCNCRIVEGNGALHKDKMWETRPDMSLPRLFVTGVAQGCAMVFTEELRRYLAGLNLSSIPMHDIIVMMYASGRKDIYWDNTPRFSYRIHESNVTVKRKKSPIQKILHTWRSWTNSSKNSMSTVAEEMLNNGTAVSDTDREFLRHMKNYRSSLSDKLWLIRYKSIQDIEYRALRSYKIRILLGLL